MILESCKRRESKGRQAEWYGVLSSAALKEFIEDNYNMLVADQTWLIGCTG